MSQQILQVNMNFSIPRADLETAWLGAAQPISDTPGLLWKVWLINEEKKEAGGIYLFENEDALLAYRFRDPVASLRFCEKTLQTLGRDAAQAAFPVHARPRSFDRCFADVAAEDLEGSAAASFTQAFQQDHRNRVRLLSCGTAGNPHSN